MIPCARKCKRGVSRSLLSGPAPPRQVPYHTSTKHKDPEVSSGEWSSHAVDEVAVATLKTGNHVCRPDVCHKGRIGRRGFCRMFFWHWARAEDPKKGPIAKMTHGIELRSRWSGNGAPPLCTSPPFKGLPALEITHPFHFKMSPAILLGPKCNHDIGVLLRLPVDISNTPSATQLQNQRQG